MPYGTALDSWHASTERHSSTFDHLEERMAHRVRPRRTEIKKRMRALGLESESAQARELDVAASIHHRALKGVREPNAFYALRLLWTLCPDLRDEIDALFDLDHEPVCEQVAS
jgi:hypothetical protein